MKRHVVVLVFFLFLGCFKKKDYYRDGKIKSTYYQKNGKYFGKYKEFYPSGNVKEIHFYENGIKVDSSIYFSKQQNIIKKDYHNKHERGTFFRKFYSENGTIEKEGNYDSLERYFGKWNFYENGILRKIAEYKIIKNNSYLNQFWECDEYGNIDSIRGGYLKIDLVKDTIRLDSPVRAKAMVISDLTRKNHSSVKVIIPKYFTSNFNETFSNIDTITLDTIFNLNIEVEYRKQMGLIEEIDYESILAFGRYFEKLGGNNLRGILVEYFDEEVVPNSVVRRERKYYFDIPVYVKDTID